MTSGLVSRPAPAAAALFGRTGLLVCLALILLTGLVFGWHARLDFHTSDFFEDMSPSWEWRHTGWAHPAHEIGHWLEAMVLATLSGELLRRLVWPGARLFAPGRLIFAALMIGAVGPHLVELAPAAADLARPRPYKNIEAYEHGDAAAFRPWWASAQTCRLHCSTTSREVAEAAVTLSAAAILPGGVGLLATGLALAFTAWTALLRVGTGEAYLSDVLFAALLLHLVAWVAFRLVGTHQGPDGDPDFVEDWLARARLTFAGWLGAARAALLRRRFRRTLAAE